MLKTKEAKKLLTKKEQTHLTEMKINSIAVFKTTRAMQILQSKESTIEPCFTCKFIARKLSME